jgi:mRNA-degrading endonuclease RelE of RelBE toxin-antitoxin system
MFKKLAIVGLLVLTSVSGVAAKTEIDKVERVEKNTILERLQKLQTTRREQKVKRVEDRLCKFNRGRVMEFRKVTEALTNRLDRITKVSREVEAGGVDTSGVETLLATANDKIVVVKQVVSQLTITDCATLSVGEGAREEAKAALETAKLNLEKIKTAMAEARRAVNDAAVALKAASGKGVE